MITKKQISSSLLTKTRDTRIVHSFKDERHKILIE